tara:strand:- start:1537 stop:1653 length:117 start_codon:yes stop_codon:yes gene_type:complete
MAMIKFRGDCELADFEQQEKNRRRGWIAAAAETSARKP